MAHGRWRCFRVCFRNGRGKQFLILLYQPFHILIDGHGIPLRMVFSLLEAPTTSLQVATGNDTQTSTENNPSVWHNLWNACVPPKIRNFGWCALKNGLPVKANLALRGMNVDVLCPR